MRLSETVDTSKNEEVRPLELNQISPIYENKFKDIFQSLTFRQKYEHAVEENLLQKKDLEKIIEEHENIISSIIKLNPVKKTLFFLQT